MLHFPKLWTAFILICIPNGDYSETLSVTVTEGTSYLFKSNFIASWYITRNGVTEMVASCNSTICKSTANDYQAGYLDDKMGTYLNVTVYGSITKVYCSQTVWLINVIGQDTASIISFTANGLSSTLFIDGGNDVTLKCSGSGPSGTTFNLYRSSVSQPLVTNQQSTYLEYIMRNVLCGTSFYVGCLAGDDVRTSRDILISVNKCREKEIASINFFSANGLFNKLFIDGGNVVLLSCSGNGPPGTTFFLYRDNIDNLLISTNLSTSLEYIIRNVSCDTSFNVGCQAESDIEYAKEITITVTKCQIQGHILSLTANLLESPIVNISRGGYVTLRCSGSGPEGTAFTLYKNSLNNTLVSENSNQHLEYTIYDVTCENKLFYIGCQAGDDVKKITIKVLLCPDPSEIAFFTANSQTKSLEVEPGSEVNIFCLAKEPGAKLTLYDGTVDTPLYTAYDSRLKHTITMDNTRCGANYVIGCQANEDFSSALEINITIICSDRDNLKLIWPLASVGVLVVMTATTVGVVCWIRHVKTRARPIVLRTDQTLSDNVIDLDPQTDIRRIPRWEPTRDATQADRPALLPSYSEVTQNPNVYRPPLASAIPSAPLYALPPPQYKLLSQRQEPKSYLMKDAV